VGVVSVTGWEQLTERERMVARMAGQQIARRLQITTHTVNFHLRQIFRKLHISSRVSLAAQAAAQSVRAEE
jgi:DNA-binding CsgD family transcriptional regulator